MLKLKETTVTLYRRENILDQFPNLLLQGAFIRPYYRMKLTLHGDGYIRHSQQDYDYVLLSVESPTHDVLFTMEGKDESVLPKMLEQAQRLLPAFYIPQNISLYTTTTKG